MRAKHILPASAVIFVLCGMAIILAAASNGQEPAPQPVNTDGPYYDEVTAPDFTGYPETTTEQTARAYTDADAELLAKIVWAEARGVKTTAEKAAVIWCILNRYDAGTYGDSIAAVATAPHQFAYREGSPVEPELKALALDVLARWQAEKEGTDDVGRVLPAEYTFFDGDGVSNHFRQDYGRTGGTWSWSLPSPYEEDRP